MRRNPGQRALRKGRVSVPGAWYSVTKCTRDRQPLLVADPLRPLADARAAGIIEESLRLFHEHSHWDCKGYVVMPDHVHVVFALGPDRNLSNVMASFAKRTVKRINALLGGAGPVWQDGFYDHCLRDERAFLEHLRYVHENPLRQGWVRRAEDWPFGAAPPDW